MVCMERPFMSVSKESDFCLSRSELARIYPYDVKDVDMLQSFVQYHPDDFCMCFKKHLSFSFLRIPEPEKS